MQVADQLNGTNRSLCYLCRSFDQINHGKASKTIYLMTEEERVQKRCRDREDYYASLRSHEECIAELEEKVNMLITEKDNALAEKDKIIAELKAQISKNNK